MQPDNLRELRNDPPIPEQLTTFGRLGELAEEVCGRKVVIRPSRKHSRDTMLELTSNPRLCRW